MKQAGFTLIETLVAVAIMGILAAIIYANLNEGGAQGRDTERQSDLGTIQAALELYKFEYGEYPAGCGVPSTWSGQKGSGTYECSNGQYIVGLAPEFIPVLPVDPKLNGDDSGYMYASDGEVYKLMAKDTVETDLIPTGECGAGDNSHLVWGGYDSSGNRGCDL